MSGDLSPLLKAHQYFRGVCDETGVSAVLIATPSRLRARAGNAATNENCLSSW
jgi:hypothetical protein